MVFLTPDGKPFAKIIGYHQRQEFLKRFSQAVGGRETLRSLLSQAKRFDGKERARKLDAALAGIQPAWAYEFYRSEIEQIIELDVEGQLGLKTKSYL